MTHRFRFIDFSSVAAASFFALYLGLALNIFSDAPNEPRKAVTLELDELLLVCAVLLLGLLWAVRRLVRERREVARRIATEREIRTLAFHDALTGLPNRRQFDDALRAAIAAPPRARASHAVLMLDLNAFKKINDVFGHAVGDEVLVHVAARLSRAMRAGDLIARFGGDEFAILSTQLSGPEAATGLTLRIIEELDKPITIGGREHRVGAALGVALTPQDGTDPAELLRKADIALYRAKGKGRSATRFFEPEMDAYVQERDRLEHAFGQALRCGQIQPRYQPVYDLRSGFLSEFEATPHWADAEFGTVDPVRFIQIADDGGLAAELTDALLGRAMGDAVGWPAHVRLAVRVSPLLLHDSSFDLRVIAHLGRSGFSPQRLELEIAENAIVRDLEAAQTVLGRLRLAGVRITLTDFGTGYSSLYHLRNFKFDGVRIDRGLVDTMATNLESAAVVRALVGLGLGLGIEVAAEGVDTAEQRQMLSDQGCSQGQGDLYSGALEAPQALAIARGTGAAIAMGQD